MAWIEIHKQAWGEDPWTWSCAVCHYGMNVPWESCRSWWVAINQAHHHIHDHYAVGQRLTWRPIL